MPRPKRFKDTAEYQRWYREQNKERLNKRRRELRQKRLEKELAASTARNRAKGHQERIEGRKRRTRIAVNTQRRWVIYEDRVYCNSQIGFTLDDLKAMMQALREAD